MGWWKLIALPALAKLGFWGIGAIALLDSSTIPVPMDAILAVYIWNNKSHFWLYCLMAAIGSAIGGLLPYGLGRAGGELFLLKRINRERFDRLRLRFERQEFLAVMIPSMLPPPAPWKMFIFAAGVFEMRVLPFMLAVFAGRMVRWLILSAAGAQTRPRRSRPRRPSRTRPGRRGRPARGARLYLVVDQEKTLRQTPRRLREWPSMGSAGSRAGPRGKDFIAGAETHRKSLGPLVG